MNAPERLELELKDTQSLRRAFMPFVRNGGVFVPTDRQYALGEEVTVSIRMFDTPEPMVVEGAVIWVTPFRAQGRRTAGVGVQFGPDEHFRSLVDERLGNSASSADEPTHTL